MSEQWRRQGGGVGGRAGAGRLTGGDGLPEQRGQLRVGRAFDVSELAEERLFERGEHDGSDPGLARTAGPTEPVDVLMEEAKSFCCGL